MITILLIPFFKDISTELEECVCSSILFKKKAAKTDESIQKKNKEKIF